MLVGVVIMLVGVAGIISCDNPVEHGNPSDHHRNHMIYRNSDLSVIRK